MLSELGATWLLCDPGYSSLPPTPLPKTGTSHFPPQVAEGRGRECCLPGNEDAEQIHLIWSRQEHDNAESQLQEEESSHHSVNPIAAAEGQEVEVVEVGGNVGNT